ncbi:hypothetical protein C8J56DRAFT_1110406 [Mycena floridula]|nr:hypothetical protein C8J56DRAFT_1110406 [Mycena floridula]
MDLRYSISIKCCSISLFSFTSSTMVHLFRCNPCAREFGTQAALISHDITKHPARVARNSSLSGDDSNLCTICDKTFDKFDRLIEHYRGSPKHLKCPLCGTGCFDSAAQEEHIRQIHETAAPKGKRTKNTLATSSARSTSVHARKARLVLAPTASACHLSSISTAPVSPTSSTPTFASIPGRRVRPALRKRRPAELIQTELSSLPASVSVSPTMATSSSIRPSDVPAQPCDACLRGLPLVDALFITICAHIYCLGCLEGVVEVGDHCPQIDLLSGVRIFCQLSQAKMPTCRKER